MARINVEDSIYRDERFMKLAVKLGAKEMAMGALVFAWDSAQYWYTKAANKDIPIAEWNKMRFASELIEVGLAEQTEFGIRVKGRDEACKFVKSQQKKGKQSALKRKENLSNPGQPSQPSSSSSSSKKNNTNTAREEKISETENSHSDSTPSRQPDLKSQIQSCLNEWKETLSVRNIERDPRLDENKIARLIKVYDVERVQSAIRGMRFEPSGKDFNPNANCYIARLEKPDAFNRLETIGSSKANKPVEKKLYKHAQV